MKTRAIIFDLFGTLTPAPWGKFVASIHTMASALDIDGQVFFEAWTEQTSTRRNTGDFCSLGDEILWICKQNGVKPSEDSLTAAVEIRYNFTKGILHPRADAVSTLSSLRSRGMLTGLISDCSKEVPELWPETLFVGLFDSEIFSCSVGLRKPDPAIYRLACERLDVQPGECFYIGDGFSGELKGARECGMRPFLILPPNEERPQSTSWEGANWNGDMIPSLSGILEVLREEPHKADAGDDK
jgi:putative hydrolase of the HAD superfamily